MRIGSLYIFVTILVILGHAARIKHPRDLDDEIEDVALEQEIQKPKASTAKEMYLKHIGADPFTGRLSDDLNAIGEELTASVEKSESEKKIQEFLNDHPTIDEYGSGDSSDIEAAAEFVQQHGRVDDMVSTGPSNVRAKVLASVYRCWRPSSYPSDRDRDPEKLGEMLQALGIELRTLHSEMALGREEVLHPVLMSNSLGMFGPAQSIMPHHHVIGLTSEGGLSRCLNFDYTAERGSDPGGCRFFQESFKLIQTMSRCVEPKIADDPYYKMRRILLDNENMTAAMLAHKIKAAVPALPDVTAAMVTEERERWAACSGKTFADCASMDTYARTMDLLKRVGYKRWEKISFSSLRQIIKGSILKTRSAPLKSPLPSLSETTVESIMESCFFVPSEDAWGFPPIKQVQEAVAEDASNLLADDDAPSGYGGLYTPYLKWFNKQLLAWKKAFLYQASLTCLPLMWDQVEVPRAPYQLLWYNWGQRPRVAEYEDMSPLCARLALAPIASAWRSRETRYANSSFELVQDSMNTPGDAKCLRKTHVTCRTLAICWEVMLRTHIADLNAYCAPVRLVHDHKLFDVTDIVQTDKFVSTGFRCCCDKHKEQNNFLEMSIPKSARAGYCKIVDKKKCGPVRVAESTQRAHVYWDTDGRCEILQQGLHYYLEKHSPHDYCSGIGKHLMEAEPVYQAVNSIEGSVGIPDGALGETVIAPCLDGTVGHVTCLYNSPREGRWSTVQCEGIIPAGWCPGHHPSEDAFHSEGMPKVGAARIGQKVRVSCAVPEFEADQEIVTCGSMNAYVPTPLCVRRSEEETSGSRGHKLSVDPGADKARSSGPPVYGLAREVEYGLGLAGLQ